MNRLALVLAVSLAVSVASAASATAGPDGEVKPSERASQHGSSAPATASRPTPKPKPPAPAPANRPAPAKKPSNSARPTAPKNTGHGANVPGPYDPSGVGSPSQNGKGTGGRGRPCAGCVGRADTKNPRGQMPGGADHNAGYECDRNEGVGKTNPAHTGCGEQSSVGPLTNDKAPAAVIARADVLELASAGTAPARVRADADAAPAEVLAAQATGSSPNRSSGNGARLIAATDPSSGAETTLPSTGLALGLMALLGAAFASSGLFLRRRVEAVPSGD